MVQKVSKAGSLDESCKQILHASQRELSQVRGSLYRANGGTLPKTILITSARAGEGKTTTAIALSTALAKQQQARTLLVAADNSTSPLQQLFNLDEASGLSEYLEGQEVAPQPSEFDGLDVFPWGTADTDLWERLTDSKLLTRWQTICDQYGLVVIDGPAVLSSPHTQSIHQAMDASLLVVQCEVTKWQVAKVAADRLSLSGGHLLGTVMNQRKYYVPGKLYGKF